MGGKHAVMRRHRSEREVVKLRNWAIIGSHCSRGASSTQRKFIFSSISKAFFKCMLCINLFIFIARGKNGEKSHFM